ncbi:MAG: hypothetical protein ACR2KV_14395, partial [Solirubrobacteraceae bacterium]
MIAVAGIGALAEQVAVIVLVLLAAFALLGAGRPELERPRAVAMLLALLATPALLAATIWDSPQIRPLHDHPLRGAIAVLAALAVVAVLAVLLTRRREAFPLLVLATLPFRVPISAGGQTSNLLVPLYVVVAAATVAYVGAALRGRPAGTGSGAAGSGVSTAEATTAEAAAVRDDPVIAGRGARADPQDATDVGDDVS